MHLLKFITRRHAFHLAISIRLTFWCFYTVNAKARIFYVSVYNIHQYCLLIKIATNFELDERLQNLNFYQINLCSGILQLQKGVNIERSFLVFCMFFTVFDIIVCTEEGNVIHVIRKKKRKVFLVMLEHNRCTDTCKYT